MKKILENNMDRRSFLKAAGIGAAAVTAAACAPDKAAPSTAKEKEPGEMTYRKNSKGEDVSILGYGCMRWPTIKDSDGDGQEDFDQESINEMVDYAIAHGVTYFDTAPVYSRGLSQKLTGNALKRHPRESFTIATKLSNQRGEPTFENGVAMYHKSFEDLQVDYVDYYLLHSIGGGKVPMETLKKRFFDNGLLDFLVKEREEGRIRNLGFSFHGSQEVFDYMMGLHDKGEYHWDFVQIQMNYIDWKHGALHEEPNSEYLYNELYKRSIPVVIMEPLLGGQLATLNDKASRQLRAITPNSSIASWAFRFCGTHPGVMTVLSGMTYLEHVKDNVKTFSPLVPLTEDELNLLEDVAKIFVDFPLVPCTACNYCMPCPYGLDIPGVFAHYNKCINEGYVSEDEAGTKEYRKARRAFLVSLDRNVEKLRQANHCIGCRKCMEACPQKIDIPHTMRRIDSYTEKIRRNG